MPDTRLPGLRRLYELPGPFVTIYVPAPSTRPDAAQLLALRWKSLRKELATRGAAEDDLCALDGAALEHAGGDVLVAVATQGHVVAREMMNGHVPRRTGDAGPLPMLAPLLAWQQTVVTQLVVTADRTGAELTIVEGAEPVGSSALVGETEQIHKAQVGGWSQKRYQRRVEHAWERNAAEVAAEVVETVAQSGAEIVHLAGDERALGYLEDNLAAHVRPLVRRAEGLLDHSSPALREAAAALVAGRTAALVEEFAERRGRHDRATEGIRPTLEALAAGRVETLLIAVSLGDRRHAWIGETPVPLAVDARHARSLGLEPARRARLADAAIRAALGTGAAIRCIPPDAPSAPFAGIGALTRY